MLIRWCLRSVPCAIALLALLPAQSQAQLSTVGTQFGVASGGTAYARTADVGYDSGRNAFLYVTTEHQSGWVTGSFGSVNGGLVATNGSNGFRIDTTGNFPFGPALAYSSHADAFLVVWVTNNGQVRGRLVRYGTGPLGTADFLIGTGGRNTWAPAIAYSNTSQQFLVSWSSAQGPNYVVRVSAAGSVIGAPAQASSNIWTQHPAVAWNAAGDDFLVVYAAEFSSGWRIVGRRIDGGVPVGSEFTVHASGGTRLPDIAYSSHSGKYLVSWFQYSPYGIYGRLLNTDGSAASSVQPLLPSSYGTYDANSLAYNEHSDTFGLATITPVSGLDTVGGTEVSSTGVPGSSLVYVQPGGKNRFYPEIVGSTANGRFATVFNRSQSVFEGQVLNTTTTDGGPSGGGGASVPDPAPPPPGPAPLSVTLTSNVSFPQPVGTLVTFTATAAGGTAPLQYQFVTYHANTGWIIAQPYSSNNKYTYYPGTGQNIVQVWVRNAGSTADYDAYASSGYFSITGGPPVINSLTANVTFPQPVGTSVTFTATASGGTGPLQYQFVTYHPNTGWIIAQPYSTNNKYTYFPGVGDNVVQVWVRSAGSMATYEDWETSGFFTITNNSPARITSFTSNVSFPAMVGTLVTFTATATGGTGPIEYQFVTYHPNTGWIIAQPYSKYNTYSYYPGIGQNAVQVWVRSVGSAATYQDWKTSGLFTITEIPKAKGVTLTASTTFPKPAGTSVTFTAAAIGAVVPVEYQFVTFNSNQGWKISRAYSSSPTFTYTPPAGTNAVQVWVRNVGSSADYDVWASSGFFAITP